MKLQSGAIVAGFLFLAGCGEKDVILPGERLDIRAPINASSEQNQSVAIRLSAPVNHAAWTHRAGTAQHTKQHAAFGSSPNVIWSASIGQGNDRRHRITASPVAANGRIFTLDSRATVTATSTSGSTVWSRDLTPAGENANDASGGGLAVVGGVLFVTTGFGDVLAVNASDGAVIWRHELNAPATGAPTVSGGRVYVVTRNSVALALNAKDGRIDWQLDGTPSASGVVGGAAPAVGPRLVMLPFSSSEIVAAYPKGGVRVWGSYIAGSRGGVAYASVTDITGDPVIVGNKTYVGNPSGRTVALDNRSGKRIWTAAEGAVGPVTVDGGSVFLVSDTGELVRLDAQNGARIWGVSLPHFVAVRRAKRQRDIYSHFGPTLAGGRLWIASGDGQLRAYDPKNGALVTSVALANGAATRPIVVGGTMYVVNQKGTLIALR